MDGAGAGGAARERRKQLTAAEAVNHKRQLAQIVERELALTGADSVTDFADALQMVLVETGQTTCTQVGCTLATRPKKNTTPCYATVWRLRA